MSGGWLDDLAGVAVAEHSYNILVVHVLQDGDLVVDGEDGVVVSAKELLLQNLDSDELGWISTGSAKVDF